MSSQSAYKQNKDSKYYRTNEMVEAKKIRDADKNKSAINHVKKDDGTPLGFRFEGPKKRDLTPAQKNARNVAKRMRKAG